MNTLPDFADASRLEPTPRPIQAFPCDEETPAVGRCDPGPSVTGFVCGTQSEPIPIRGSQTLGLDISPFAGAMLVQILERTPANDGAFMRKKETARAGALRALSRGRRSDRRW